MGLNHANAGLDISTPVTLPGPGDFALEHNVPAMEYLMLAGGQFSKSESTQYGCHHFWSASIRHIKILSKHKYARKS